MKRGGGMLRKQVKAIGLVAALAAQTVWAEKAPENSELLDDASIRHVVKEALERVENPNPPQDILSETTPPPAPPVSREKKDVPPARAE